MDQKSNDDDDDDNESMLHIIDRRNDRIKANYMDNQKDLNSCMREILVDWMIVVCLVLNKHRHITIEHLFCAVRLVDWVLSNRVFSRTKIQLLGITALFMVHKFDYHYAHDDSLTLIDCVNSCDRAFSRYQLIEMEVLIINTLHSVMMAPSWLFLPIDACAEARELLLYSLCDYRALSFRPSQLAEGAVAFSSGNRDHCTAEYFHWALNRKRKYVNFRKLNIMFN
jgi:G2/mitotic-specific cyclin 1/2